jgi:hypothetical protein
MATSLQLVKFKITVLNEKRRNNSSPIICVVGKRNTGKSEIIKNIMYHNRDIPSGIIISPTEQGNSFYSSFCPSLFIHYTYDTLLLKNILDRQKKLIKKNGHHPKYDFFVILDDCMFNKTEINKDINLRQFFMNGRHFQIFLIMSVQYIMDLSVTLRTNIDFVFAMKENNIQNIERLYNSFFGIFSSKQLFIQAFNQITENYGCIVLDNLSRSNNITETVYWYRSPYPHIEFKVGNKKIWKLHNKYYDANKEFENDSTIVNTSQPVTNITLVKK